MFYIDKALKYTPPPCTNGNLPGYIDNNMDCYKLDPVPRTWQDAMNNCKNDGTTLVSAVTIYEQAFIDTLLGTLSTPAWIGLADIAVMSVSLILIHNFLFVNKSNQNRNKNL